MLSMIWWVGAVGFEPTTSSAQGWRATRLRYTPRYDTDKMQKAKLEI